MLTQAPQEKRDMEVRMVTSCSSAFGAQKVQLTEPSQAKHTFLSEGEQELSKRGHELI